MHHLPNVNERNLARYLTDGLAAMRHSVRAYETASNHVADEELRLKLGEFKADQARLYELTRVALRSIGGEPRVGKEVLATAGTLFASAIAGAQQDELAQAREVKNLLGGEYMGRWDWQNLARIGETAGHHATLLAAREGITVTERHILYLEDKTREMFDMALAPTRPAPEPVTASAAEDLPSRAF